MTSMHCRFDARCASADTSLVARSHFLKRSPQTRGETKCVSQPHRPLLFSRSTTTVNARQLARHISPHTWSKRHWTIRRSGPSFAWHPCRSTPLHRRATFPPRSLARLRRHVVPAHVVRRSSASRSEVEARRGVVAVHARVGAAGVHADPVQQTTGPTADDAQSTGHHTQTRTPGQRDASSAWDHSMETANG
jgi:hypothetical protein